MRTAKKGEGSVYSKFFLLGILLLILPVSIKIYTNSKIVLKDSSLDGSEAIEIEQNTIPADVQQYVDQQRKVLGETTAGSPQGTSTGPSVRVPILMYHYVEYVKDAGDKIRISLNTTPYTLEQEVSTLSHAGYTFMTSVELTDVLDGKGKLPPKPIVLTFDDGYRAFYQAQSCLCWAIYMYSWDGHVCHLLRTRIGWALYSSTGMDVGACGDHSCRFNLRSYKGSTC